MKSMMIITALTLALSAPAFAEETKSAPAENAVNAMTGKDKKPRKKKVDMCGECGKPESECECHGHKDGKKDETQKTGDSHNH